MQNKNAYVSQKEVPFPAGTVLVSKTDTKGILTYVNDQFEKISGYTRAELIGKSHNIVRHPDMPPQAFEWLWNTIKQELPWRAQVKNRCKNGDHYWVRATVAPIIENNRITGYVSVRQPPTRAQVSESEALYRELNQSGAKIVSRYERFKFKNWPIFLKLNSGVQVALLVMLGLGHVFLSSNLDVPASMQMKLIGAQAVLQVLLFFILNFCVNRCVVSRVRTMAADMKDIMQGNLEGEVDIDGRDELGRLLCEVQSMRTFLRTMVDEIGVPITQIQGSIKDLDARVASVAANAMTEQDHIQSIAATMEEYSQSVAEVANMAADSLADAQAMRKTVEENNRNMELSITSTTKVADTVQSSSKTISDLGVSIQKIGAIANAIKDIADQTNLLALNAAIEAARAGEQGRGFAVVADEVRKLAERTATSTKDIASTIGEINAISGAAVKSMQGAVVDVANGIDLIRKNGEGLKEIMAAAESVSGRIEHIASASKEQSVAGQSVANSLENVTGLVDSNTLSARDAKTAAESLAKSADELKKAGYPLTKCAMG
ncbi:MAG TPA: methyl-accepting chemotaxis protein [Gallionella sp.]|nr:methyl-accepting chemotaxis protein [Gallionella sp.]